MLPLLLPAEIYFPTKDILPSIPVNMSQTFKASDVASHNKPDSLYIIVDDDVYDVTKFQDEHPGMSHFLLLS